MASRKINNPRFNVFHTHPEYIKIWEDTCKPLRNVKWVKKGGKKLVVHSDVKSLS